MTRATRPGPRPGATAAALLVALLVALTSLLAPPAYDGFHTPDTVTGSVSVSARASGAPAADDAQPAVRTAAVRVHGDLPAPPAPATLVPRHPAELLPPGIPAPPTAVPLSVRPRPADGHPLRAPPLPPGI
ncbi:hypothetical protein P1P75_12830 [Streptomyces sp. ID05-39B]|uniref:hypothetical protein n=1 Tax=Streptomyces sp. ID05-39B TaxID=3028664 RepID=UPI0029AC7B6E|nr:hypothetical protein [Streptomyces sp. ID05-39B]MDX3527301.1 hypothetical protein [Streptomyces sp. ID05-39B]